MERFEEFRLLILALILSRSDYNDEVLDEFVLRLLSDRRFFESRDSDKFIEEIIYRIRRSRKRRINFDDFSKRATRDIDDLKEQFSFVQSRNEKLEKRIYSDLIDKQRYLEKSLLKVNDLINKLSKTVDNSTDELHEFIWKSALDLKIEDRLNYSFLPVRIYLPENPNSSKTTEGIKRAIILFGKEFGFITAYDYPEQSGSWWKKFWFRTKEKLNKDEVKEKLEKAERALELNYLDKPQAEANKSQAEAAACLIQSLANVPNACIQTGSLLLVKVTKNGEASLITKTLSLKELRYLEKNQAFLKDPNKILDWLQNVNQKQLE